MSQQRTSLGNGEPNLNDQADAGLRTTLKEMADGADINDASALDRGLANIEKAVAQKADVAGWTGQTFTDAMTRYRSGAYRTWIESRARRDPLNAQRYLEEHWDKMVPEDRDLAEKIVNGSIEGKKGIT